MPRPPSYYQILWILPLLSRDSEAFQRGGCFHQDCRAPSTTRVGIGRRRRASFITGALRTWHPFGLSRKRSIVSAPSLSRRQVAVNEADLNHHGQDEATSWYSSSTSHDASSSWSSSSTSVPSPQFLQDIDGWIQEQLLNPYGITWESLSQQLLQQVNERHLADCQRTTPLEMENQKQQMQNQEQQTFPFQSKSSWLPFNDPKEESSPPIMPFEWISVGKAGGDAAQPYKIALQSKPDGAPLLTQSSIHTLRQAAEEHWQRQEQDDQAQSSRFTYQRPGNYEAHIADLGPLVTEDILNPLLLQHIYPAIRTHFQSGNELGTRTEMDYDNSRLFVYDALYIRYNSTEAAAAAAASSNTDQSPGQKTASRTAGAGQPLHRDLSLVSVNVMLNEGFHGGGTFFENQLLGDSATTRQGTDTAGDTTTTISPLKPEGGVGHCLLHSSLERHAGANTWEGVRDVMVIFVSATGQPRPIQNALLKQGAATHWPLDKVDDMLPPFWRSLCQNRLALTLLPEDGEAYQYLANALVAAADYYEGMSTTTTSGASSDAKISASQQILQWACQAFQEACRLAPCDARSYNNLGLAYTKLRDRTLHLPAAMAPVNNGMIQETYHRGMMILEQSHLAGCNVSRDRAALRLNYGLFVANQDDWEGAAAILQPLVSFARTISTGAPSKEDVVLNNARRLYDMCIRELKKERSGTMQKY